MDLKFWAGHENAEDLVLAQETGCQISVVDAGDVTGLAIKLSGSVLSSADIPEAFEWPVALRYRDAAGREAEAQGIRIQLGQTLAVGTYQGWLVVYSADHPDGLVWDNLMIRVL